jgi:quercetin 2,3-dioxygenase
VVLVSYIASWNDLRIMKIALRKSSDRGHANHGWLDSHHTFSFADYYDPAQMGFRSLRVINEDRVSAGGGFPTHPHRDMEIFTYVVSGTLEHKDSMGNGRQLQPGQIQLMSAGSGVAHSEFNPSRTEPAHFLQIWIKPRAQGLTPSYTEWHPSPESETAPKVLVISSDGREKSATIQQDTDVYRVRLQAGQSIQHEVATGRGLWLQLVHGEISANQTPLTAGDAISTDDAGIFNITATADCEAILFDLA